MAQEQFAFFLAGFYANSHKTPNKKSMGETVDILEYCHVIRMACYLDPKTSFGYYSDPSNHSKHIFNWSLFIQICPIGASPLLGKKINWYKISLDRRANFV
jgi:hypothetical protein